MEKEKLEDKKLTLQGLFILFLLFFLTLGLGIVVSLKLYEFLEIQEITLTSISPLQFLGDFLLALFLVLIAFLVGQKFKKKRKYLFKTLFLMATVIGGIVSLGVFLGDWAIVLIFPLAFFWLIRPNILVQDTLIILGMAGAGSLLGTRLEPATVVLLLIIFSLYDYIAVYKTKHMIHMAREMIKEGAVLGLVLPQKTSDFKSPLQKVVPGAGRFFVLGGGDVVFPLLLCSSVLPRGLTHSLVVAGFSLFGLFLSIFVFSRQKKRQPIPALPPIALFAIIGYAATLLF